ncbi:hypothetical protein O5833_28365, partial [Escherichia coli]|nr:hypothetical protein [Escherichia coli]
IPNKLEGRGCQCQRLVKVVDIDDALALKLGMKREHMLQQKVEKEGADIDTARLLRESAYDRQSVRTDYRKEPGFFHVDFPAEVIH